VKLVASLQETFDNSGIWRRAARLFRTLRQLISDMLGLGSSELQHYRFWIDPLLCPVKLPLASQGLSQTDMDEANTICLKKMKDIYQKAIHVLVIDASFSGLPAHNMDPTELLFRVVGSSAWTRRLWTLQGIYF
jgi:hypothetical protein